MIVKTLIIAQAQDYFHPNEIEIQNKRPPMASKSPNFRILTEVYSAHHPSQYYKLCPYCPRGMCSQSSQSFQLSLKLLNSRSLKELRQQNAREFTALTNLQASQKNKKKTKQ